VPGTLKPDPGKSSTPIDRAKAKGSQIPSPSPEMKWNSPPLLKLRMNVDKGVSEASSDATIPAWKQLMQVQVTPVDEKPRMHENASMVVVQNDETMFEVDNLDVYTDDEPPKCNVEQEGRERAVWNLCGVARPKRRAILRQTATDSAQDVISRVKWTLDHEQQFEGYLTILETLAANYAEIRG
jgi:hypothetical protein